MKRNYINKNLQFRYDEPYHKMCLLYWMWYNGNNEITHTNVLSGWSERQRTFWMWINCCFFHGGNEHELTGCILSTYGGKQVFIVICWMQFQVWGYHVTRRCLFEVVFWPAGLCLRFSCDLQVYIWGCHVNYWFLFEDTMCLPGLCLKL